MKAFQTLRYMLFAGGTLVLAATLPGKAAPGHPDLAPTATPIRHLVIIYDENVSFDHYFATYPKALNPGGEPAFHAAAGTPAVNGLSTALQEHNPNVLPPFRLKRSEAATADQDHEYSNEQEAYDGGRMDRFVQGTGKGKLGLVMGYFDGNTVTALWNYAQHFTLSDNTFTDTYGPSTPGALEVIAGQTHGALWATHPGPASTWNSDPRTLQDATGHLTLIGDVDPAGDKCSSSPYQIRMAGHNIGDLLNAAGVSWGNFMGGFNLERFHADGEKGCGAGTLSPGIGKKIPDYIPHHNGFQYYPSTANPSHARPSSLSAVGHSFEADGKTPEPANHQYDLEDFFDAVRTGNFPAVSYLKAPAFQDAHAGYSNPVDEQAFLVRVLNFLQGQPDWKNTAVIITYDDSDGWYDHLYQPPLHPSHDGRADRLSARGRCGTGPLPAGIDGQPVNGRCGPGTRIPLLIISPWVKPNHVDHRLITQASVVRFIEDNWLSGKRLGEGSFDDQAGNLALLFDFNAGHHRARPLWLDPATGLPVAQEDRPGRDRSDRSARLRP